MTGTAPGVKPFRDKVAKPETRALRHSSPDSPACGKASDVTLSAVQCDARPRDHGLLLTLRPKPRHGRLYGHTIPLAGAGRRLSEAATQRSSALRDTYRYAILSGGRVSEWFMVPLSKSGVLSKAPRVRIPPLPPGPRFAWRVGGRLLAMLPSGAVWRSPIVA